MNMNKTQSKRHRMTLLLLIIMLFLLAGGILFLRYQAQHQMGGLSRKPVLTLKGDDTITVYPGEKFQNSGYTAKNFHGDDITNKVKVQTSFPGVRKDGTLWKSGKGTVTYTLSDSGNTVTKKRSIRTAYRKPDSSSPHYGHGIAVCMFHNIYDPKNPPEDLNTNYMSQDELSAILKYLIDNNYYFPSWQELRDYIDGKIDLPVKSVVLTFDDCTKNFQKYGIPILEKYDVEATSFVICAKNGKEVLQKYKDVNHINFQSHSYNMHRPGGPIGHGGIFPALSVEEGVEDLKKSIDMLGSGEAFAYPFGDYTDTCEEAVKEAGFLCAFTTEYGTVHPGDDPYLLPRIRVNGGCTPQEFAESIQG